MVDSDLKDLFRDVLADEPPVTASIQEDLARGRARRTRRRQLRLAVAGAALAAAGTAALLVPPLVDNVQVPAASDEVWPYSTPARPEAADVEPQSGGPGQSSVEATSGLLSDAGADPLERAIWAAVRSALPAGVSVTAPGFTGRDVGQGYGLSFTAARSQAVFTVDVVVQASLPDLDVFRPCTEPAQTPSAVQLWSSCSQGWDDDGRWRIVGEAGDFTGVAVADGGSAAITVVWSPVIDDRPGATFDLARTLSPEDANAIAEAAWRVGSRYDADELAAGTDPGWNFAAIQPEVQLVEAMLELALGPVEELSADLTNPEYVTATYSTADAGEVTITMWSRGERYYASLCRLLTACEQWPGSIDYFAGLDADGDSVVVTSASIGRQLRLDVEAPGADAYAKLQAALGLTLARVSPP